MFDAIGNMPLHPLVIHAAVVGIPLTVLLALLFAVPRTRSWARWPLALTAVGSLAATFVAKESGEALQPVVAPEGSSAAPLIAQHAMLATQLLVIMAVLTVLVLVNVFLVGRRTDDRSSGPRNHTLLGVVLPLLLVLVALLAGAWVFRVGDVGSRAVWNPTGSVDYSISGSR